MTSTREAAPAAEMAVDQRPYEVNRDGASPNRNLTPVTTVLDPEGRLVVGGCVLSDLARCYGTPLYVIDEATLRGTAQAYRKAQASIHRTKKMPPHRATPGEFNHPIV